MKRYYCDRCDRHIDIDSDGFAQMRVMWWCRGGSERLAYRPDIMHRDGDAVYMFCAKCANEVFGKLEGMEQA